MNLKSSNKIESTFSMSSMTDIVFLLLVFFMLTSSSIKGLDIILPKGKGKPSNSKNITVSIDALGNYYLNEKEILAEELPLQIENIISAMITPVIVLRAEKTVPMQKVVYVMDIANKRQCKIVLAVNPR